MVEGHLCAGHADFDRRFAELVGLVRDADWGGAERHWASFAADLLHHMDYEEAELFVEFGRETSANAAVARDLIAEHADIRTMLERISNDLRARTRDAPALESFVEALREHSQREDTLFYPWLEQRRGAKRGGRSMPSR